MLHVVQFNQRFPPLSPRYAICRLTDLSWNGDGKGDPRFVWPHRGIIAFLVFANIMVTFLPIDSSMARSTTSTVALILIFTPTAVNVFMNAVALLKRMMRFINEDRAYLPR